MRIAPSTGQASTQAAQETPELRRQVSPLQTARPMLISSDRIGRKAEVSQEAAQGNSGHNTQGVSAGTIRGRGSSTIAPTGQASAQAPQAVHSRANASPAAAPGGLSGGRSGTFAADASSPSRP